MAKNEAKIKFTAETGSFNQAIKQADNRMSELRAEMKLNATQMKATGTTVEGLENKHEILAAQLKASESKTEALNQKVQKAVEIFGENSEEAHKLKVQLLNAQNAEEKLRQSVSACETELDQQKTAAKEAENAFEGLTDKVNRQQDELNRLKREYVDAVGEFGEASSEAKTLEKEISELSTELRENKTKLNNVKEEADKLDKSFEEVKDSADDASEGFTVMKGVAANLVTAGLEMVAEAAGEVIEAFNEVDEGADNVIKATGATGEAAEGLTKSYEKVASSVVGDFGSIGSALGEINTRFGYTGKKLEECSTDFLKFSEITGVDSTEAVQMVSRALNDAGIPLDDYGSLLDQLAKAGQAAGIDVTKLTEGLSVNGATMRAMGLDTSETIALLAQFEVSGADASTMLTGMKKAFANWSDAGKDGSKEFAKLVEGIKNGSVSASDAMDIFGAKAGPQLVAAIKSGKFEYKDMLATIQDSKGTTDSTFDELIDGGYEADLAMQQAKLTFAEIGDTVLTTAAPAFDDITNALSAMAEGFAAAVEWGREHKGVLAAVAIAIGIVAAGIGAYNIVQGIKAAMDAAQVTTIWALVSAHLAQAAAAIAAVAPYILIVAAIAAVIAIIVLCIKHWDDIVAAVKKCWEKVKETLSQWGEWINANVIQPVVEFFKGLWDSITEACAAAWDWVKGVFSSFVSWVSTNVIEPVVNFFTGLWDSLKAIWDGICNVVQVAIMLIGSIINAAFQIITLPFRFIWENCKDVLISVWNTIKSAVSTAINTVKSVIQKVMNAIKTVFSTVWNAIKSTVTTVVNAVKSVITKVWNSVKSVTSSVWNSIKSVVLTVWNGIKSVVTSAVNAVKSVVTSVWNTIKSVTASAFNAVKSVASSVWNGIKNAISNVVNGIKSKVSSVFNSVKSTVSSVFNGIKSTATSVWNGIKNAIITPIEAAKNKVKSVVDSIKGFFSGMKLSLPKIKLPHFKITGKLSLDPPSVPKLSISWYKEGGIMTRPTIFGVNGNSLMAGGEAGPEAILPIDKLEGYVENAVEKTMQKLNIQPLVNAIEELADRAIELNINGRRFATATASDTDNVSGLRSSFKSRGLVLD